MPKIRKHTTGVQGPSETQDLPVPATLISFVKEMGGRTGEQQEGDKATTFKERELQKRANAEPEGREREKDFVADLTHAESLRAQKEREQRLKDLGIGM